MLLKKVESIYITLKEMDCNRSFKLHYHTLVVRYSQGEKY